jgi:hypothetical protein
MRRVIISASHQKLSQLSNKGGLKGGEYVAWDGGKINTKLRKETRMK